MPAYPCNDLPSSPFHHFAFTLSFFLQLPPHLILSRTAIHCVGEFAGWLMHHEETQVVALQYLLAVRCKQKCFLLV